MNNKNSNIELQNTNSQTLKATETEPITSNELTAPTKNSAKPKTSKQKNIHEGHRKRLRQTFENADVTTMPQLQVLELMLSFIQPRKDVNPIAHALLNEFGSFSAVLDASPSDLTKIDGVGNIMASYINFCSKIPAVYNNCKTSNKQTLNTPNQIVEFLQNKIVFSNQEQFYYLCLNNKGNILCFKNLGTGSASNLIIDQRLLIQQILKFPTSTLIICHTHPNGTPYPSTEDKLFTNNLLPILHHLNIKLADHIIISPEGHFSFFQNGIINN